MKKKASKAPATSADTTGLDEILPEYDLRGGVRGKYAARYAEGTNVVLLDPDVAAIFPDATAVNEALRALAKIAERTPRRAASKHRTA